MGGLFLFFFRIRVFMLFLILEGLSLWLLFSANSYQGVVWLNSSNAVAGRILEISGTVNSYFYLNTENAELARENANLNARLKAMEAERASFGLDTMHFPRPIEYKYRVAKVINNSVARVKNFMTINRGTEDGIKAGMGVISALGVVGRVKNCSAHYSTITSALHSDMLISAGIKRNNAFGTIRWEGNNPYQARMLYIARHIKPLVGDTIITSDYSTVFPSGIMVGKIAKIKLNDNETFYDITVNLSTDFSTLSYVYVIENTLKAERDSLQQPTNPELK
ncbi:MAG: rod shape-determining protein MreC [Bacteroidota bacterium]